MSLQPLNIFGTNLSKFFDTFDRDFGITPEYTRWDFPELSRAMKYQLQSQPKVDIIEKNGKILVKANVAGYDKDNILVELENDKLTLKGKASQHSENDSNTQNEKILYKEWNQTEFERHFKLPEIDAKSAKANFKDGILTIEIDKQQNQSKVKIPIQ